MDKLIVEGPSQFSGEVDISSAKNAYLPILAAILLTDEKIKLKNLPELRDISTMLRLLQKLGVNIEREGEWTTFNASSLSSVSATYDLVKTMRASIFVLGPLLARIGEAQVSLPGGCAIGTRPIDLHLTNLEKLGADFQIEEGYVKAEGKNLQSGKVVLSFPSVGATENLMMAAVKTKGETIIENAAKEPEVEDLGNFLNALGARVSGHGTSVVRICGVEKLHGTEYRAIGDRIEASTYIMAALTTNSKIHVKGFNPRHIDFILERLKDMGADLEVGESFVNVRPSNLRGIKMETAPYPGFPTDAQAQLMALMTKVEGSSLIVENIFENRFMHVPELNRLGADIHLEGNTAFITPVEKLSGAPVMCTDLRASAALVIAALGAEGKSEIQRVYHLDRGYEKLDNKFQQMGANIQRVKE